MFCRFTIDGLVQNEYGSLSGYIESISSDAITMEGNTYFKVTVSFDATELVSRTGKEVPIVNGMTAKVWTIYKQRTYMESILE